MHNAQHSLKCWKKLAKITIASSLLTATIAIPAVSSINQTKKSINSKKMDSSTIVGDTTTLSATDLFTGDQVNGNISITYDANEQTITIDGVDSDFALVNGILKNDITIDKKSGYHVISIGDNAFSSASIEGSLDLSEGNIQDIGYRAFCRCYRITSLKLPGSLSNVNAEAFEFCNSFYSVDLSKFSDDAPPTWPTGCLPGREHAEWLIPYTLSNDRLSAWTDVITNISPWGPSVIGFNVTASLYASGVTSGNFIVHLNDITNVSSSLTLTNGVDIQATNLEIKSDANINAIAENAFKNNNNLTGSLVLPSSVASIGNNAFNGCTNLSTIDLTNYTSIPSGFQDNCFGELNSDIIIPASADTTVLGSWYDAISNWTGNTSSNVYTTDSAKNWADGVTSGNFKLKVNSSDGSIVLVDGRTVIATNLSINNKIDTIADKAFEDNTNLVGTLTLPSCITSIGTDAFSGCNGLTTIDLSNYTSIPADFHDGCFAGLVSTEFLIPSTNNKKTLSEWYAQIIKWTGETSLKVYTINSAKNWANGVTSGDFKLKINNSTCSSISIVDATNVIANNLSISNYASITSIGKNAFQNNSNVVGTLTLPNSLTNIEKNAFAECTNISSIYLPDSVTTIEENAFYNNNVSSIFFAFWKDGPINKSFGANCFYSKSSNINLYVWKNTVESYTNDWFEKVGLDTTQVQHIYSCYDNSRCDIFTDPSAVGYYVCDENNINQKTIVQAIDVAGTNVQFSSHIIKIQSNVFANCINLSGSLTLPNTLSCVETNAFSGCNNINTLYLENSPSVYEQNAFSNMNGLQYVFIDANTWPTSLDDIKTEFTRMGITNDIKIGEYDEPASNLFSAGLSSNQITVDVIIDKDIDPNNYRYTVIDGSQVIGKDLILNNQVVGLEDYCFKDAYIHNSFSISNSVNNIGKDIFMDCYDLHTIYLNWTPDQFSSNDLSVDTTWLDSVKNNRNFQCIVPQGMTKIYQQNADKLGLTGIKISDGTYNLMPIILGLGIPLALETIGLITILAIYLVKRKKNKGKTKELPKDPKKMDKYLVKQIKKGNLQNITSIPKQTSTIVEQPVQTSSNQTQVQIPADNDPEPKKKLSKQEKKQLKQEEKARAKQEKLINKELKKIDKDKQQNSTSISKSIYPLPMQTTQDNKTNNSSQPETNHPQTQTTVDNQSEPEKKLSKLEKKKLKQEQKARAKQEKMINKELKKLNKGK